jgi:hypothetical protein
MIIKHPNPNTVEILKIEAFSEYSFNPRNTNIPPSRGGSKNQANDSGKFLSEKT